MAKLAHPQKRAQSSMLRFIEARRGAGDGEAADWLSREWNPFLPQDDAGWRNRTTGFDAMAAEYRWGHWLAERKETLKPLFAAAFPRAANGFSPCPKLLAMAAAQSHGGAGDLLQLLLDLGADPNSPPGTNTVPALNLATPHGAKLLLASGCSPKRVSGHPSAWEAWALRAAHSNRIDLTDLDWMASVCPPDACHPDYLPGEQAIIHGKTELVERLSKLGAGPAAFGIETQPKLASTLRIIVKNADSAGMLAAITRIAGDTQTLAAFALDEQGRSSAAAIAIYEGRVRCLGAMEKVGLLKHPGCSALELSSLNAMHWAQVHSDAYQRYRDPVFYGTPNPAGAAWAMSRIPAKQAEQASRILATYVTANPMLAAKVAQSACAKGFASASGPNSLAELYKNGELWIESLAAKHAEFAEFLSLCDIKILRKTLGKKTEKTTVKQRL